MNPLRRGTAVLALYDHLSHGTKIVVQTASINKSMTDVKAVDRFGETALMKECRRGDLMSVKSLLDMGSSVNQQDVEGRNSIMWAAREGHYNIVNLLLERDADVHAESTEGRTALMFAARNGYSDICRALLDAGAALNKKTKRGETALMMAAETGRVHTVSLLIERGATTHDMTVDGVTPLMMACASMKNDDRFKEIAKIISKTLANVFTTKALLHGRMHIYRLLTDPSITLVEFTDEYIKDCTSNFSKEAKVAEGAFGAVFQGVDSQDQKLKIVVKRPNLKFTSPSSIQKMHDTFSRDVVALMRARHPNVARLLGYSINAQDTKEVYFVFESPTNGSLFDALASEKKRALLTGQRRVKIMFELARVMAYLHKGVVVENSAPIPFVHRDVKASNVYLNSDYSIKLMDCGLSSLVKDPVSQSDIAFQLTDGWQVFGSQGYVCPQYASAKVTTYTPPCDVYSFGIVMMELLTGWLQFGNLAKKYQERSVLIGGVDIHAGETWNSVLGELCDLALSCVQLELTSRPSSDHVFETLKEIYSRLLSSPNASPMKY